MRVFHTILVQYLRRNSGISSIQYFDSGSTFFRQRCNLSAISGCHGGRYEGDGSRL
jgi:hypothetical protein